MTGGGDRSWSQERSGSQPGALESSHSSPLSVPPILSSRRVKRLHPSEEFVQQPLLIEVNKKFHTRNGSISTFFTYNYMNVKIKIFENTGINIIFICIVYFTNLSFRNGKVDKKTKLGLETSQCQPYNNLFIELWLIVFSPIINNFVTRICELCSFL